MTEYQAIVKPFIGWAQIGEYMSCTAETARRRHARRRMPISWIGNKPQIHPDKLQEWMDEGRRKN